MFIRYLRAPDGAEGAGGSAPAAPAAPASPAAAAPAAPAAAAAPSAVPPPAPGEPPHYASVREAERRKVLKELGYKPAKGVPSAQAIAEAKQKQESQKERRRAAEEGLKTATAKIAELEGRVGALKQFAEIEMASLDETTRATVKTLAGDDPAEQLRQIAASRAYAMANAAPPAAPAAAAPAAPPAAPAAAAPAAAAPAAPAAAAPLAPIPPPAQSAPAQPGPAPSLPPEPKNIRAEVERLAKGSIQDQLQARLLILQNPAAYAASKSTT